MTSRSVRLLLASLFALTCLLTAAFGQGSSKKMLLSPSDDDNLDRPDLRAKWNQRGRTAPPGASAAALRLQAHGQKMAMRAARAAAAAKAGTAAELAAPGTSWTPLGPAPLASDATGTGFQDYSWVSGRATSVLIDPSDTTGNTVLLGGAYGGLWRSTNAGNSDPSLVTWQALIDNQPTLAVGAIALKPGNSNVILVGTGETNSSGDSYYGLGVFRSVNGGSTWTQITSAVSGQSFLGVGFSKIAFSTANPDLVVAATAGDLGLARGKEQDAASTARGLYFSTDAGATWNRAILSDSADPSSVTSVVYNASQGTGGTFYAAIRRHGVYSSSDGQHFTRLATQPSPGLVSGSCPAHPGTATTCLIYRGEFAVTPGRNEMYVWLYDLQSSELDKGIWRTTDGGGSWTQILNTGITSCGDGNGCGVQQGFYNLELAAVPATTTTTDLYAGTINLYKCTLAPGATATSCSQSSWINLTHVYGCNPLGAPAHVHPDQHGLDFMLVSGKAVGYFAHDGGISRTLDGFTGLTTGSCTGTNQFDSISQTLGSMTEFVSFSVHPSSADILLGGTQDNGSPKTATGTSSTTWQNAFSGDGGFNAINPTNGNDWFISLPDGGPGSQGFQIGECSLGTGCDDNGFGLVANPSVLGGDHGPFYTPYILDPQNPNNQMFIGTCRVWRLSATGSALRLSNNFDTLGTGVCSGNEVVQVTALDAGGTKDASNNSKVIYAVTDGTGPLAASGGVHRGGEVWVTTNAGTTLMADKTGSINPQHYAVSSVAIDKTDTTGQTAYVGIMGFSTPGFPTSHIWKTTNAGTTWTDWTGNLPNAPVDALLVDSSVSPSQIYAGTDAGIFASSATSASWTEVGPAPSSGSAGFLPNAPVTAIRMFNSGGVKKLRVSTYGRGIWEFTLAAPTPDYALAISNTPLTVAPNLTATFNGTLTAVNGYNSPVTLTCGAGAPGACTFTPSSPITPTAGGFAFTVSMNSGGTAGTFNFNIHAVGNDINTTTHDAPVVLNVADFTLTGIDSHTVLAGQTTKGYVFTAAPTNGAPTFVADVIFSCSGLPDSTAACVFNPTKIAAGTLAGQGQVTMTITTAGPNQGQGSSSTRLSPRASQPSRSPWLAFTLPIAGILFAGFAGRKVAKHSAVLGLCVSVIFLGLMVACGGGGSSGPPPPPPVTVTVTPSTIVNLFAKTSNAWPVTATQQQFSATVNNSTNQAVTWAVTGGDTNGTITANGLYTSPASVPSGTQPITVTATAAAGGTPGSGRVNILAPTKLGTFPITVTATEGSKSHSSSDGTSTLVVQ